MGWKAIENECVLGCEKKQTNGYSEKENKEDGVRDEWREVAELASEELVVRSQTAGHNRSWNVHF